MMMHRLFRRRAKTSPGSCDESSILTVPTGNSVQPIFPFGLKLLHDGEGVVVGYIYKDESIHFWSHLTELQRNRIPSTITQAKAAVRMMSRIIFTNYIKLQKADETGHRSPPSGGALILQINLGPGTSARNDRSLLPNHDLYAFASLGWEWNNHICVHVHVPLALGVEQLQRRNFLRTRAVVGIVLAKDRRKDGVQLLASEAHAERSQPSAVLEEAYPIKVCGNVYRAREEVKEDEGEREKKRKERI